MRPSQTDRKRRVTHRRHQRQKRANSLNLTFNRERQLLQLTAHGTFSVASVLVALTIIFIVTRLI